MTPLRIPRLCRRYVIRRVRRVVCALVLALGAAALGSAISEMAQRKCPPGSSRRASVGHLPICVHALRK